MCENLFFRFGANKVKIRIFLQGGGGGIGKGMPRWQVCVGLLTGAEIY